MSATIRKLRAEGEITIHLPNHSMVQGDRSRRVITILTSLMEELFSGVVTWTVHGSTITLRAAE